MAVNAAYMLAHFPDLPGVSSTTYVDAKLDEARLQVKESVWGDRWDLGVSYLAAHLILLQKSAQGSSISGSRTVVSGPVTSERVGDLSRSYGTGGSSSSTSASQSYDSTSYGREFKRLLGSIVTGPIVY